MSFIGGLWVIVGSVLVLVVPGWAWSFALFPERRSLLAPRSGRREVDLVERLALALTLSLVLVPFGAIVWNGMLHVPLGSLGSFALLAVLTVGGWAVARWAPGLLRVKAAAQRDPADLDPQDD